MTELVLIKNNEQHITLWKMVIGSDFELECLADCIKAAQAMIMEISRNYGTESLRLELDDKEIDGEVLVDKESLAEYLKEQLEE